jgi:hypothetical protein
LIGIGAGLLLGRPDVGALVGLGIGFIAMGIAKMMNSPKTCLSSIMARSSFPVLLGIVSIIAGLGLAYFPAIIWLYFWPLVFIVAGTWFLLRAATRHGSEKPDEDE